MTHLPKGNRGDGPSTCMKSTSPACVLWFRSGGLTLNPPEVGQFQPDFTDGCPSACWGEVKICEMTKDPAHQTGMGHHYTRGPQVCLGPTSGILDPQLRLAPELEVAEARASNSEPGRRSPDWPDASTRPADADRSLLTWGQYPRTKATRDFNRSVSFSPAPSLSLRLSLWTLSKVFDLPLDLGA